MIDCIITLLKRAFFILSSLKLWSALGTFVLLWISYDFFIYGFDIRTLIIGTFYSFAFGILSWMSLFDKKEIKGSTFCKLFILLSIYIPTVLTMIISGSLMAIGREDLSKLIGKDIGVKEFFYLLCQLTLLLSICIPIVFNDLNKRLRKINEKMQN
ncbi:hypothetical protein [Rodentibacter pneumotropicus]|nr:hypothetical protein [Rodentibacter pneumotropicus]